MLTNDTRTLDRYLTRLALRSPLTQEERQAILALPSSSSKKAAGSSFVASGDEIDHACVVLTGLVSSFKQTRDGTRQIMALHICGDMADLPSIMLAEAVSGLEALSDVTMLHIPLPALFAVSEAYPRIALALWRDGAADAAIQMAWANNVGRKSARSRLAHLFCEMGARYEQTGSRVGLGFELLMTQEQLADATAITPVHLNRTLMSLRADGILDMRNKLVQVFDWPALIKAADFDPRYLSFRLANAH